MKTERRHELKTNTLAEALAGAPRQGWRYTSVTIGVALACVLIFLLVRYRVEASRQRKAQAADNLAVAREEIDEIKRMQLMAVDPTQPAELARDISTRIDSVMASMGDSDPKMAAEALVARGDLSWTMAAIASATTQPTPGAAAPADLLKNAQSAYQQVETGYPQQAFAVNTARFGLAAIAENQHDWDTARKQYQAVVDDSDAGEVLQAHAHRMLDSVDQLAQAPVIGAPVPPATQPTTLPSLNMNVPLPGK